MTLALAIIEGVALLVLALFVIALLRSHAEILRRLAGAEGAAPAPPASAGAMARSELAPDIAAHTLAGDAVKVGVGSGSPTTLLAFLSSGCAACGALWREAPEHTGLPRGTRVIIVAKGAEQESPARLRELAPAGAEVLMSSDAWSEYSVPGSPHFVLVHGASGRIAGRGFAGSWEQIGSMAAQAMADTAEVAEQATPGGAREGRPEGTSARATLAEDALTAAGIGPGHESLYPGGAEDGSP